MNKKNLLIEPKFFFLNEMFLQRTKFEQVH